MENEYSIYKNFGERIAYERLPEGGELYQIAWRPVEASKFSKEREIPQTSGVFEGSVETAKPKKMLVLPKSTGFGEFMKSEMKQETTTEP